MSPAAARSGARNPQGASKASHRRGRVVLFNKPYGVLSQFTDGAARQTLAAYISVPGVYAAGRLDRDSEGLLVLTDDGELQTRLANPRFKTSKRYWVQVEGRPSAAALGALRAGVLLSDGMSAPAAATEIGEPETLWSRQPPVRFRARLPTTWLEVVLCEGRNRQVRRMTAAVGHPTLRLIRAAVGPWRVDGLAPGEWRMLDAG